MTTIAITGIGGFIGLRMAERAVDEGWTVRGFDIDPDGVSRAKDIGADAVVGDVGDPESYAGVFDDVDVVFHTAAIVDEAGDRARFYRVNVEGTRHVAEAAQQAGVERFVHLSSVMVYGFDYPAGVDESFEFPDVDNIYCETKRESEKVARSFHDPERMGVIAIRPGDVYGAGSRPWVRRPMEMMDSGLFTLPDGGRGVINHVYIDNLLDAVFLAIQQDATGEVFNVTDDCATPSIDFYRYHADMRGDGDLSTAPAVVLKAFLTVAGPVFRLFGAEPPATPEAMNFMLRKHKVSTDKARDELGYTPRVSLQEGMERVEKRLRDQGEL